MHLFLGLDKPYLKSRKNQIFYEKYGGTITLYDLRHFYHTFAISQWS